MITDGVSKSISDKSVPNSIFKPVDKFPVKEEQKQSQPRVLINGKPAQIKPGTTTYYNPTTDTYSYVLNNTSTYAGDSLYSSELAKASERARIQEEQNRKIAEAKKIADEKQRNIAVANIKLQASQEREQFQSSGVQLQEFGRQFQEKYGDAPKGSQFYFGAKPQPVKTTETPSKINTLTNTGMFGGIDIKASQPKYSLDYFIKSFQFGYQRAEQKGREVTYPILTDKNIQAVSKSASIFGSPFPLALSKEYRQFSEGVYSGVLTDIKEQPVKQAITFGVGYGVGVGLKTVGIGAELYQGTKVGQYTGRYVDPFKLGDIAVGVGGGLLTGYQALEVGSRIKQSKSYFEAGSILGVEGKDVGLFGYGTVKGLKGFDSFRTYIKTIGKPEVPYEKIKAPEYPKQTYPQIRKGQTAGELKKEFEIPIVELGETPGTKGGFSATSSYFKKQTAIAKGSSELPGLYTSPKLSPKFLRLDGESTAISILPKDVLKPQYPTALRIYSDVELVPGLKPSTKRIQPLSNRLKQLFESELPKGKQFIPFIKTEKEAIIPFTKDIGLIEINPKDIMFSRTDKGDRFLIRKFKTITDEELTKPKTSKGKIYSSKEFETLISSSKGSSYKYPISLTGLRSYNYSSNKSYLYKPSYNYYSSGTSYIKSLTSKTSYKTSYSNPFKFYYSAGSSKTYYPGKGSSAGYTPGYKYFNYSQSKKPFIDYGNEQRKKKKTSKTKKGREGLFIVEGFISSIFKRTRKIKVKDLYKEAKRYSSPFALRERPIIVK